MYDGVHDMSIEIILFLTITALAAAFGISVAVWSIINTRRKSVENSPKTQRIYLDADVTPTEAATMIAAMFGAVYADELVDALIDVMNPRRITDSDRA